MPTSIKDIPELNPYDDKLRALGYDTIEKLIAASNGAAPEIAAYLNLRSLNSIINPGLYNRASMPTSAQTTALAKLPCTTGATITIQSIKNVVSLPPTSINPPNLPEVNLISSTNTVNWSVRNQGDRGTCVAHAAVACLEYYLIKSAAYRDMSEQFLYWNCKRTDGHPKQEGTWISTAFNLLKRDGCCEEGTWPYNPLIIASNESQDPPQMGVGPTLAASLAFKIFESVELPPKSIIDIKNALASNHCVAFSIPVYDSWYHSPIVRSTGDILLPVPGEVAKGGHAMCLVGYKDLPNRPELGGGIFILRNSWSAAWGAACAYGAGYGTIPYIYLARECMEAYMVG